MDKSAFYNDTFLQESFIGELTEENLKILNESLNLENLQ